MYDDLEKVKNDDVLNFELAGMGTRFIAIVIDSIIISVASSIFLVFAAGSGGSFALGTLLQFGYYWYFWTRHDGQSPGKRLMKIKVIKTDGSPLNDGDVVLRFIGYWVSGLLFGLGYIWAAFDAQSQGWHDKIASTYVVVAEEEKKKFVSV